MHRRATLAAAAAAALVPALVAVAADPPRTHEVVMEGVQFVPATLKVRRGDSVVWINRDAFAHTATAVGAFDSRSIAAGKSWRHHADRAGSFAYVCTLHPTMKGTLEVE